MYIHEYKKWPHFIWHNEKIADLLASVRYQQGRLLGRMSALGFQTREEATLQMLTQDVIKTSEIEGESLDREQVRSSIAKRLGLSLKHLGVKPDRNVEGIVEVMLDATRHYDMPLTKKRLWAWHKALFSSEHLLHSITIGKWRTKSSGVMQVVSGAYGREKIHFIAPSYNRLQKEMSAFITWFNTVSSVDDVVKSGIAHFWFVTIHPFEDGNGRIARALADMVLAQGEKSRQRFYSMSTQIQQERKAYYTILETCQKGSLDITLWIEWYLGCLGRAIVTSEMLLESILTKARFWEKHQTESLNERQRLMINKLLDGLHGKLTSSKWAKITKCSQDTALRDINDLINRRILKKEESGGRSTSYELNTNNFKNRL